MKNISINCILTCIFITVSYAQAQIFFEKTYGGSSSDVGCSAIQTTDGGYIVVGYTASYGAGGSDVYLIKTDSLGDTLWAKVFGGTNEDYGISVYQTLDGGYILAGTTASGSSGTLDMFLLKTDSLGILEWREIYGGTGSDNGNGACVTPDGGYIIAGSTTSFGGCLVYCIRTDTVGDIIWENTYDTGGAWNDGFGVANTADGGCIITGAVDWGPIVDDVLLIKIAYDGSEEWTRTFGPAAYTDEGYSVAQTYDGGYIVTGVGNGGNVYLIKTNSYGQLNWSEYYGGTSGDAGRSVIQSIDSCYIVAGHTASYGTGGVDVYLIKIDLNGDMVWWKTYGSTDDDFGRSVFQTTDGGYVVAGTKGSWAAADVYLIKTDENGNQRINEPCENTDYNISDNKVYCAPNPFNTNTSIFYSICEPSHVTVKIYNVSGQCVRILCNTWQGAGLYRSAWDGRDDANHRVSAGVYYIEIDINNRYKDVEKVVFLY